MKPGDPQSPYRSVRKVKTGPSDSVDLATQWWSVEGAPDQELLNAVRLIARNQIAYRQDCLDFACLYGDSPILALTPWAHARRRFLAHPDRVSYNLIQSVIAAITAKITQSRPKPQFQTTEGDWALRTLGKRLTAATEGLFYEAHHYEIAEDVFVDCAIFGTGIEKIYEDDGEVCCERVMPWDVLVDDADGYYRRPRSVYQAAWIDRGILADRFPDSADQIKTAGASLLALGADSYRWMSTADLVQTVEAWHLPTKKGAGDGRHVLAIDGVTLLDEKWEQEFFPFVVMRWLNRPAGWYGQGLAEQLCGRQVEINRLLRFVQQSFKAGSNLKVFLNTASGVATQHLTDQIGVIIKHNGEPPVFAPSQTVHPEVFSHLRDLIQGGFELAGISRMEAGGLKPAGVNSGKAMRTLSNLTSERFVSIGHEWETFHVEAGRQMVALASAIAKRDGSYDVRARTKRGILPLDFSQLQLAEKEHIIQAFPTSALSTNPAERMQDVQELAQDGWLPPDEAMRLLDWPDTEGYMRKRLAPREIIDRALDKIVEDGSYTAPESVGWDLAYGEQSAAQRVALEEMDGIDEDRAQMLRDFATACHRLANPPPSPDQQAAAMAQLPPGAAPPPGGPPGGPPPPPMPPGPPPGPMN